MMPAGYSSVVGSNIDVTGLAESNDCDKPNIDNHSNGLSSRFVSDPALCIDVCTVSYGIFNVQQIVLNS